MNEVQSNIMTLVSRTGTMFRRNVNIARLRRRTGFDESIYRLDGKFGRSGTIETASERLRILSTAIAVFHFSAQSSARVEHPAPPEDIVLELA